MANQKKHNLLESWIAVVLANPDISMAQAVRDMNDELQASYTPQRVNDWRRGDRAIPEPVHAYMLRTAILHVLGESLGADVARSATSRRLTKLVEMITPPIRRE